MEIRLRVSIVAVQMTQKMLCVILMLSIDAPSYLVIGAPPHSTSPQSESSLLHLSLFMY